MTKSANLVTSITVEINAPASLVWMVFMGIRNLLLMTDLRLVRNERSLDFQ